MKNFFKNRKVKLAIALLIFIPWVIWVGNYWLLFLIMELIQFGIHQMEV